MSNSGSRLYLTCRIFPARDALAGVAHQRQECSRIQSFLQLTYTANNLDASHGPKLPLFDSRNPTGPNVRRALPAVFLRQSAAPFAFPRAAQIPPPRDIPKPKPIDHHWSTRATSRERLEEPGTPETGASICVPADVRRDETNRPGANYAESAASGASRSRAHPSAG